MLLLIFAIISIFFPKYRSFVKEAWQCFVNKLLMKKCEASFDTRIKASLVAYFIQRGKIKTAKFVNKYFNVLITLAGVALIAISILLFYLFIEWIILGHSPCIENGTVCKVEI